MLFATGGMDGRVIVWDLHSLKSKGRRRGQRAGVECLSYDGVATLLAGGYALSPCWLSPTCIHSPLSLLGSLRL